MLDKKTARNQNKIKLKSKKVIGTKECLKAIWLLKRLKSKKIKNILIFIPLAYESKILLLRKELCAKKYRLFAPFMLDESLKIVKLRLPFFKGRFGVRQAANSNARTPRLDAAFIPVIGVDRNMARIGHGKGFYDRFFASLFFNPYIIFLSAQDLFVNASVCDPHDIIGDFYITPKNIRTNHDRNHHRSSRWGNRRWGWLPSS